MKKPLPFIMIASLTSCVSPALQTDIFSSSNADMEKVALECRNKTAHEKHAHISAINCRFDAYEVILGERGFHEYNDLDRLRDNFLYVAKQQDSRKLSDKNANILFEKYIREFYDDLQKRDSVKIKAYNIQKQQIAEVISAIAIGLGNGMQSVGNSYSNAAASQHQSAMQIQQDINYKRQEQQQEKIQKQLDEQKDQILQEQQDKQRWDNMSPADRMLDKYHEHPELSPAERLLNQ